MAYLMTPADVKKVVDQAVLADRAIRRSTFSVTHGVTQREWEAMVALAVHGSQLRGAASLGISLQTFKNLLGSARRRLQAAHILDAYQAIGWLILPDHPEQPEGDVSDTITLHGHYFVHIAACPCKGERT